MKCKLHLVVVLMLVSAARPLFSQAGQLIIPQKQKQTVYVSGAFAGFSRDPAVARASIAGDVVSIEGVGGGETEIVVLAANDEKQVVKVRCTAADSGAQQQATNKSSAPATPSQQQAEKDSVEARAGPAPAWNSATARIPVADSLSKPANTLNSSASDLEPNQIAVRYSERSAMTLGQAISVREISQVLVPVSQVNAAYSLDPLIAEAQLVEAQVRVWGRAPGQAVIVLVHSDFTTSSMQVTVTKAPPILPDSPWNGLNSNGRDSKGYYEVRMTSNPLLVNDTFDYRAKRVELHFNNTVVPGQNLQGSSTVNFPFTYLRLLGDRWRLTLLDEDVESSAISVSSTLLRGIHASVGGLAIHAGYTSVAGFQSLLLPTHKQLISGATFTHHLNPNSEIGMTGYFIQRDRTAFDQQTAQAVGTLFFKSHTKQWSDLSAEVGLSNGIGGAVRATHSSDAGQFHIAARFRPRRYAASETDNLTGLQSETRWGHAWGRHFVSDLSGSANRIFARAGAQTVEVATGNLRYKASNGISLSSGVSISRFADSHALFPDIRRFAVPVMIAYDRPRFGVGAQYEYSQISQGFSPGHGYRGSLRWSGQHFQMNASAGLDTQTLGIDSVFSAFPNLNVELAQLGLGTATSIEQLAALLTNRALLNNLGVAPSASLQLVPRNWHAALNLSWRAGRQVLETDSNYNLNSFLIQQSTTVLQTVRYRRGVSNSTELVASFSLLDSVAPVRRLDPIWEIGLRHQFGNSPFPHVHQHNGAISGTVRLQDSSGIQLVRAVDIMLDGDKRTSSDSQGHYRFSNVRQGIHTVQIAFKSSRPFWYTTPSKVSTLVDSIVDFGVMYPAAQIIGYVLDDAGMGLSDVGVLVKGPQGELNFTTDQSGRFFVPVAQTGAYIARVNAETVPDGYALEEMQPASISVGDSESKKISFVLPAIRALSGSVQKYDPAKEAYAPLAGVTVELAELARVAITDSNGRYSFRNMPSGGFTIFVNGERYGEVQLSPAPQLLRQDIKLTPGALSVARRR